MTTRFTRYELRKLFDVYAVAKLNKHPLIGKYTKRGLVLLSGHHYNSSAWNLRIAVDHCMKDHDAPKSSRHTQNFCLESIETLCEAIDKLENLHVKQKTIKTGV